MEVNRLTETRYGKMLYNKNDTIIGKSLELYGEWYQSELDFLKKFIPKGASCLDIGANIGTHTLFFADAVGENGVVIAFEPQRLIFQLLLANIAINNVLNVFACQMALGDVMGRVKLVPVNYLTPGNFGGVSVEKREEGLNFFNSVEEVPIDHLNLKKVDLIKIDVEGYETRVLEGGKKTIEKLRPLLYVENHIEKYSKGVIEKIQSFDYDVYEHLAPGFNPNNFKNNPNNSLHGAYKETNIFCIPKEKMFEVPLKKL
ncbi:FkbM family methyltransferase [Criblamydia sequanensis]|uniref:Methyltransferase n=1 Tax=Candidatus Criblamydia sequanensis CRIB-18 TaxID=1437425 RepID=A0A090D0Z2_9BACT|nr:FkbM family methyltransferase [Criblamydia sequanensis]CDR35227.1 Methyltransferase [Criblamydia sequanensis CRIB-18]